MLNGAAEVWEDSSRRAFQEKELLCIPMLSPKVAGRFVAPEARGGIVAGGASHRFGVLSEGAPEGRWKEGLPQIAVVVFHAAALEEF